MDGVAEEFEWFADWADGVAPLYEELAASVPTDERLLAIAAESSAGQPSPNLLFGAVHSLLLDGSGHQLAEFYPTCCENPTAPDDELFTAFREFCLAHEKVIRKLVRSRRVQTNAIGRSAVLFPAFKHVLGNNSDRPVATVEIGSSAGLNLFWDQFQYEYDGYGTYGNTASPVRIETAVRGEREPPFWQDQPEISRRVGIDINTLDVTAPADRRWLRALVMPDQPWRLDRLDAAIELVSPDPPRLVEGDALAVLPDVLDEIPPGVDICVFSTLVLYQFADSDVAELRSLLAEQSKNQRIHWLSDDPSGAQTPPTYRCVSFEDGIQTRQLAEYKAHGEWIEWLAGER